MPSYFQNLSPRTKLVILVFSIFLLSLSVGMLALGDNLVGADSLSADILKHSKDQIHHLGQ